MTAPCASAGVCVCVCGFRRYCRHCPTDQAPLSRVPVLSPLRLIISSLSFTRRRSSFNSRRPSLTHACSPHTRQVSISLDPFLFLPRVSITLSTPLTVTSLSLVEPPFVSRPLGPPLVATWLCAHAHAHTDTCRSRQERVKRFWL